MAKMLRCPHCDSDNTVKCSVAYQAGTTTGSFGGIGIDSEGDIGGFGGIKKSQTLFAQSISPPQAPGSSPGGLVLLIAGALGTILGFAYYADTETHAKALCIVVACAGIVCLTAGVYLLFTEHARLLKAHRLDLERWAQQWVCMRCGTRFEPRDVNV